MKLLFRLVLSLGILLLNGYGQAHALSQGVQTGTHTVNFQKAVKKSAEVLQYAQPPVISYSPLATEHEGEDMFATESEDECDESLFSKKRRYIEGSHYFSSFYTSSEADFCQYLKAHPGADEHFSYSSSKYIVLRVIRI